jgi:hypothetical protein
MMLKVAVAIDRWKLAIFERHLKDYAMKRHPGPTANTMILKVETKTVEELTPIIVAAQAECAHHGKTKH